MTLQLRSSVTISNFTWRVVGGRGFGHRMHLYKNLTFSLFFLKNNGAGISSQDGKVNTELVSSYNHITTTTKL